MVWLPFDTIRNIYHALSLCVARVCQQQRIETLFSSVSPLCFSITPSLFHSWLKTYLFHKSYPRSFTSSSRTAFADFCPHRFFWANRFLFFSFSLFFVPVPCARLSWPFRQLLSARKYIVSHRIVSYLRSHYLQPEISRRPCAKMVAVWNQNNDKTT